MGSRACCRDQREDACLDRAVVDEGMGNCYNNIIKFGGR